MQTKQFWTSLTGLGLAAALALPAWAAQLNGRVMSVDPAAHTITTLEGRRPFVFTVTEQTRFVDAKGTLLAVGLQVGEVDVLAMAAQKGYFKAGSRLSINFEPQGQGLLASQVQFRDITRPIEGENQDRNQN